MKTAKQYAQQFQCHPQNIPNYRSLIKLILEDKRTITELAGLTGSTHNQISYRIRHLQNLGYVQKEFAGRERYVLLSEEGERVLGELRG